MLEYFASKLTTEFKDRLLEETRKEVKSIFNYSSYDADMKSKVEMFIVQPLFYSKLRTYAALWTKENEVSIEDIVTNNNISDDKKKEILSIIASKAGIPFVSIEETAASLLEKLFLYSDGVNIDIADIVTNSPYFNKAIPSSKHLTFTYDASSYAESKFYVPFIIEGLHTDYVFEEIHMHPVSQDELDLYKTININRRILSNALLMLDENISLSSKSISVDVKDGETSTYIINGIITSINIPSDLKDRCSIIMDKYIGFTNQTIKIKVFGPANASIPYLQVDNDTDIIEKSYDKNIATEVLYPYMLDCSIKIRSANYKSLFTDLGEYQDYENFLNELKVAISKIENPYYMPYEYKSNLWLNPFIYLESDFSVMGIISNSSILLDTIDRRSIIAKIKSIYIEETDETITL